MKKSKLNKTLISLRIAAILTYIQVFGFISFIGFLMVTKPGPIEDMIFAGTMLFLVICLPPLLYAVAIECTIPGLKKRKRWAFISSIIISVISIMIILYIPLAIIQIIGLFQSTKEFGIK